MAVVKSSKPAAAALPLATLLLFAAASAAVAQVPPPEEELGRCPADINKIIVDVALRRPLSAETLAELDRMSTREVLDCVSDNIVGAAGITSSSPGVIDGWATDVVERLHRSLSDSPFEFPINNPFDIPFPRQ